MKALLLSFLSLCVTRIIPGCTNIVESGSKFAKARRIQNAAESSLTGQDHFAQPSITYVHTRELVHYYNTSVQLNCCFGVCLKTWKLSKINYLQKN